MDGAEKSSALRLSCAMRPAIKSSAVTSSVPDEASKGLTGAGAGASQTCAEERFSGACAVASTCGTDEGAALGWDTGDTGLPGVCTVAPASGVNDGALVRCDALSHFACLLASGAGVGATVSQNTTGAGAGPEGTGAGAFGWGPGAGALLRDEPTVATTPAGPLLRAACCLRMASCFMRRRARASPSPGDGFSSGIPLACTLEGVRPS